MASVPQGQTVNMDEHNRAVARGDAVSARFPREIAQRWLVRAREESKPKKKIIWLRKISDTLATAAENLTACKEGCDHCCHIPVLITLTEARVIAKETNTAMEMPE